MRSPVSVESKRVKIGKTTKNPETVLASLNSSEELVVLKTVKGTLALTRDLPRRDHRSCLLVLNPLKTLIPQISQGKTFLLWMLFSSLLTTK